ncbi:hypothetical protein JW905_02660 [bacterium]|nr:hypothetical protein [candidate division CSSED10-310 bacterium]
MCLWIVGQYVLDVTVELNLEDYYTAASATGTPIRDLIKVEGQALRVHPRLELEVDVRGQKVKFPLRIVDDGTPIDEACELVPGRKYDLASEPMNEKVTISTIASRVNWGGGGMNVAMAIRDMSPVELTGHVKFSAISHNWVLNKVAQELNDILADSSWKGTFTGGDEDRSGEPIPGSPLEPKMPCEDAIRRVSNFMKRYDSEVNVIEWALAKANIDFALCRDGMIRRNESLLPARNLVISQVSSPRVQLKDKIVLRGAKPQLDYSIREQPAAGNKSEWNRLVTSFVDENFKNQNIYLMINSLEDPELLRQLLKKWNELENEDDDQQNNEVLGGIIAMTKTNQKHVDTMFVKKGFQHLIKRFSILMNETELASLMCTLFLHSSKRKKFYIPVIQMLLRHERERLKRLLPQEDDQLFRPENTQQVAGKLCELWKQANNPEESGETAEIEAKKTLDGIQGLFNPITENVLNLKKAIESLDILRTAVKLEGNLYLTLGKHGSMCLDRNDHVSFAKAIPGFSEGYDTTGLGDAWAAVITLLEYHTIQATRKGYNAYPQPFWREMNPRYFIKVANAVASCKFTNPYGRVFLPQLLRIMRNHYIPISEFHLPGIRKTPYTVTDADTITQRPENAERIEDALCKALENVFPMGV